MPPMALEPLAPPLPRIALNGDAGGDFSPRPRSGSSVSTSLPTQLLRVGDAAESDVDYLAAVDAALPRDVLRRKVAAGEVLVARLFTLLPVAATGPPPDEPARPILQPTPTFMPSVSVEGLARAADGLASPTDSEPPSATRTPVLASATPNTDPSPPPPADLPPAALPPRTTPSPTHGILSVEPVGFLRFGFLYDSIPFVYTLAAALGVPEFPQQAVLARLLDAWEIDMRGRGFPFALASVAAQGGEDDAQRHLLVKMGWARAGEVGMPGGAGEVFYGKELAGAQFGARHSEVLSYHAERAGPWDGA